MTGVQADVISWAVSGPEGPRVASFVAVSSKLKQFLSVREDWLKQCSRWGGVNLERWLKGKSPSFILADVIQACEASLATIAFLNSWSEFCQVSARLQDHGHTDLLTLIREYDLSPDRVAAYFRALAYEAIARQAMQANPALASFTRVAYERTIREFQRLDRDLNSLRGQAIASNIVKRPIPAGIGTGPVRTLTNRGLIEHELSKKTRHIPIRQLVRRAGKALQAIKPCFMMSPLSVAQYLPPGQIEFDLVLMDEASQVKPEDALGAILRGKQVVIVGDPKQLPPTTFFDQISDAEEDDEERIAAEETESILEIAQRTFANRTLLWHYRSQHPSLIAFSNSQFYNNELLLFPSPYTQHNEFGVQVHWIENATYKNSRNLVEALQVAEAVRAHLIEQPEVSLGVATMNSQQRDLILAEIERLQKTDGRFDVAYRQQEERDEPFFVKNLENVQGDEREVIFISTTYGRDPETQRVYQRFGPIARDKGWRRLNVLFTRARRRIDLFTSLKSNDIVLGENPSRGVVAFRNYLAFAETGHIVEIGLDSGRSPDSDFEVDVATLLIAHGYRVEAQVGVAGFFIDLGVKDPQDTGTYILGIECDGATYHSAKSVRDRDRLRQEILEAKGWKIHRIWSTDWFKNRESEIQRLLSVVASAARTSEKLKPALAS
jgi:very-short-patch-repair endonuclease